MHDFDVAIVGTGASGVLTAAHLHRRSPSLRVAVLEAGARAARGLAYGTPYGAHLLNVPAGRMSAFAEQPEHFTAWLMERAAGASSTTFAPRGLYGDYLTDVLESACAAPSGVVRIVGTAIGLTRPHDEPWRLHLHDGRVIGAQSVILALGNLRPADPLRLHDAAPSHYLRDPWAPGVAQGLPAGAPILVIGTGLTMIDLVLALRADGYRGRVHAVSRRGLLPQAHGPSPPSDIEPLDGRRTPRALLRWIRRQPDWRAAVDVLRPHAQALWRAWSMAERAAFLRHARVFWDVHRHRMAPEVGAQVAALIEEGILDVHACRVLDMREQGGGLEVRCLLRREQTERVFHVARVINCTGPASDYSHVDMPLVAQLRRAGWLTPDPLRLGIETDQDGLLIGHDGQPVPGLYTIGPLRRPALWESTAIPEIREQAAALAARLT